MAWLFYELILFETHKGMCYAHVWMERERERKISTRERGEKKDGRVGVHCILYEKNNVVITYVTYHPHLNVGPVPFISTLFLSLNLHPETKFPFCCCCLFVVFFLGGGWGCFGVFVLFMFCFVLGFFLFFVGFFLFFFYFWGGGGGVCMGYVFSAHNPPTDTVWTLSLTYKTSRTWAHSVIP